MTGQHFYLHVRKDGSEQHFDQEPKDYRSVRVERVGVFEYTRTWSKDVFFTVPERWFPTRPPGEGWVLDTIDKTERFSTWRRPAPQGGV